MSWDAKSFDKPLILLEFKTVKETVKGNAYKPDEDIEKYMADDPSSELFIKRLAEAGHLKEACDFLSYAINRRAGVWWGCLRVKDLTEEKVKYKDYKPPLLVKREEAKAKVESFIQQSKDDLAKSEAMLGDFQAKMAAMEKDVKTKSFTDPADPRTKIQEAMKKAYAREKFTALTSQLDKVIAALPPERKAGFDAAVARVNERFVEKFGKPMNEVLGEAIARSVQSDLPLSKPSPMDAAVQKLEANMAGIKASIEEQTSIFPLKIPGLPKVPSQKRVDAAYEAALRWVTAPTDVNARLAGAAGVAAGNALEGLLAQTAFWSGNNLAPANRKARLVPPHGLAAKGLLSTLFKCALAKGGILSYDDRYALHLKTGIEIAQGVNLWDEEFKKQFEGHSNPMEPFSHSHLETPAPAPVPAPEIPLAPLPGEETATTKRERLPGSIGMMLEKEDKAATKQTKRGS